MTKRIWCLAALTACACTWSVACSGDRSSTLSIPLNPTPAPGFTPGAAGATLEISKFAVTATLTHIGYVYDVDLAVSETSGKAGASIAGIEITVPSNSGDNGCLMGDLRIPPGGTWKISNLGYCEPLPVSPMRADTVTLDMQFVADDGTWIFLHAVAAVPPA